jgi:hypothetical protein
MKYVLVELVDHLKVEQVQEKLGAVQPDIDERSGAIALIVDATQMTGYDTEARKAFVAWNSEYKPKITSVAIVTNKPLWHMVIRAMSLASSQLMRPFHTREEAERWVGSTDGSAS